MSRFSWPSSPPGVCRLADDAQEAVVRRNLDGSLLVPARTSTGTIDYTEYDCTLVQGDGAWEVEECVVTITT